MTPRPKKDALTLAIERLERTIENAESKIRRIKREAEEDVAHVQKSVDKNRILLDALRRGALKP